MIIDFFSKPERAKHIYVETHKKFISPTDRPCIACAALNQPKRLSCYVDHSNAIFALALHHKESDPLKDISSAPMCLCS